MSLVDYRPDANESVINEDHMDKAKRCWLREGVRQGRGFQKAEVAAAMEERARKPAKQKSEK